MSINAHVRTGELASYDGPPFVIIGGGTRLLCLGCVERMAMLRHEMGISKESHETGPVCSQLALPDLELMIVALKAAYDQLLIHETVKRIDDPVERDRFVYGALGLWHVLDLQAALQYFEKFKQSNEAIHLRSLLSLETIDETGCIPCLCDVREIWMLSRSPIGFAVFESLARKTNRMPRFVPLSRDEFVVARTAFLESTSPVPIA